jgi:hypothetical protein
MDRPTTSSCAYVGFANTNYGYGAAGTYPQGLPFAPATTDFVLCLRRCPLPTATKGMVSRVLLQVRTY